MLFNTFSFWIIFPFIFFFYWIIPSRFNLVKKMFLIFVSYLLYMNYNVAYALVLLYVTIITYKGGLYIEKVSDKRKLFITIGAFLTLGPLLIFKYYNFLIGSGNALLEYIGLRFSLPGLNWAIPLGISFFTFQAIGYLWDVYYGRMSGEK